MGNMIRHIIPYKKGDRVRVTEQIRPGVGVPPKAGQTGTVEVQNDDGTVIVKLDDGRRAMLASWEVEPIAHFD